MGNVETEFGWENIWSIIYNEGSKPDRTFHRSKPIVYVLLITTIVKIVRMKERIQCGTAVNKVSTVHTFHFSHGSIAP